MATRGHMDWYHISICVYICWSVYIFTSALNLKSNLDSFLSITKTFSCMNKLHGAQADLEIIKVIIQGLLWVILTG